MAITIADAEGPGPHRGPVELGIDQPPALVEVRGQDPDLGQDRREHVVRPPQDHVNGALAHGAHLDHLRQLRAK